MAAASIVSEGRSVSRGGSAGEGFIAKEDLMETDGGLSEAIYQDGGAALAPHCAPLGCTVA